MPTGMRLSQNEAHRRQGIPRRFECLVNDAADPQALRDVDKHGPVLDVGHAVRGDLRDVQCDPVDVRVGLAVVNEAGGDEKVDESPPA